MADNRNRRTALWLLAVVPLMLAGSFAAVPLYRLFCQVTGYGGTTSVAEAPASEVLDQTIRVRFDANTAPDMPWEFRPIDRTMEVRLGETALAFYEAYNPTDEPIAGAASYNVAPYAAGAYFDKIACFCFEMQVLEPGERVEMPVSFFVDPAMLEDTEGRYVHDITLSYTMHRSELPEADTALGLTENAKVASGPVPDGPERQ
ncbi:cytochrome c oxidase assembly protein [Amaricoccus macauensis]|uniref:cytochrome c oxidase assembly protein n=1 Tax=Amaricoccus macauensis TaxID=57001 RepID=UPI003C7D20D0